MTTVTDRAPTQTPPPAAWWKPLVLGLVCALLGALGTRLGLSPEQVKGAQDGAAAVVSAIGEPRVGE